MSQGFDFKQFSVRHDRCAMKVGTDGVLLGALTEVGGPRVLDIGTGSGLIALMLAQRFSGAMIDAIDVDAEATAQAEENFKSSPWGERLRAVHASLADYAQADVAPYDCIVSNPPYFAPTLSAMTDGRRLARTADGLSLDALARDAARLLAPDGTLWVVLPVESAEAFRLSCWEQNLFPIHRTWVKTTERKAPRRVVMGFGRMAGTVEEGTLTLQTPDGRRTLEYAFLTGAFYLDPL